jgi:hypothetical protein
MQEEDNKDFIVCQITNNGLNIIQYDLMRKENTIRLSYQNIMPFLAVIEKYYQMKIIHKKVSNDFSIDTIEDGMITLFDCEYDINKVCILQVDSKLEIDKTDYSIDFSKIHTATITLSTNQCAELFAHILEKMKSPMWSLLITPISPN